MREAPMLERPSAADDTSPMERDAEASGSPSTSTVDDALIGEIVRRVVERFHPRRILLFGSRARGTHRSDSDIDLFVEMPTDRRPPDRCEDILKLFGLRPWSLDVVVYTPDEVAKLSGQRGTLLSVIEAEGRVLHAGA